jgi:hypothetical protein
MPSADILAIIASVAIAIAGFSGVVVALTGRTTASFGAMERLNLRILLQVSALALLFSLVPLILHRVFPAPEAWRIAMLLYGGVHLCDAGLFILKTRTSSDLSVTQRVAPILGAGIALLQLTLALLAPPVAVEVGYLSVLIWHLGIAGMGFVNLVYASGGGESR